MKTKKLIIYGVAGVAGYYAYCYYRDRKKATAVDPNKTAAAAAAAAAATLE